MHRYGLASLLGGVLWLWASVGSAGAADWIDGDIAVIGLGGTLQVYGDVGGVTGLKDDLGIVTTNPGDVAFSDGGDLYVCDRAGGQVLVYSALHPHALVQTIDTTLVPSPAAPITDPATIAFAGDGSYSIGSGTGAGVSVHQYDAAGNFLVATGLSVLPSSSGLSSLDLFADQTEFLFTSVGNNAILRGVSGNQSNAVALGGHFLHGARILPPGDGSGGYLVARQAVSACCGWVTEVTHVIEGATPIVTSYGPAGVGWWRGIGISVDGLSFWAGGAASLYQFDVATGAQLDGPIATGLTIHRVAVRGGYRASRTASPPDLNLSTVAADPTLISGFGGISTLTATVVDGAGAPLAGLNVQFQTDAGVLLGAVVDNGDGTYSQDLQATPASGPASVTATVDGSPIVLGAQVTFVDVHPDLSTVDVAPAQTYLGGVAVITVTPRDDTGAIIGTGGAIVINATQDTLVGVPVDSGDGTFSQVIQATSLGTASITATVDGLLLNTSASLTVDDPASIGAVFGVDGAGVQHPYSTIQQAVNNAALDGVSTIYVSPGDYLETVLVKNSPGLTIEALSALQPVTVQGFRVRGSTGVDLRYFDVNAAGSGRRHGVTLAGGGRKNSVVHLLGLAVSGAARHGIRVGKQNDNVTIEGCSSTGNGRDGIRMNRIGGPYLIDSCLIDGNGENGIRMGRDVSATIQYSTITNSGQLAPPNGRRSYGISRGRKPVAAPTEVTLIQNTFGGNAGRVRAGKSDADIHNYDQIIDLTDDQPPYVP